MPEPSGQLRDRIADVANRLAINKNACTNEESTKLYLILPFLTALGYDPTNPYEVYPEHAATFDPAAPNKVDLAVLRDGVPIIAIECKKVGADLTCNRGQLRSYFNALRPVKLGILTNGVVWEFFVDSDDENIMDEEPFLTLDLDTIARAGISEELLQAVAPLSKTAFEPADIAETAHELLVLKRLRTALAEELRAPSEEFCRFALQKIGLKNVRRAAIRSHYEAMVRSAIGEALVLPAAQCLRNKVGEGNAPDGAPQIDGRILTTDRELEIYAYARRRLAFLVDDELHYEAIERVLYKDYIGKLVVFFERERKGWLFDYIEGSDGCDKFMFPPPFGDIVTKDILDIDAALKAVFASRVRERMSPRPDLARSA